MAGMLCAIHQPNFLPRLSTLAKLYAADFWIILDDVQLHAATTSTAATSPSADAYLPGRWLTLPVHLPGGRATMIRDTRLAEPALTAKRTSSILRQYCRPAPYRSDVLDLIPWIEEVIAGTGRLANVSEHATIALLRLLNWPSAVCRSSGILGLRRPFRAARRPHPCRRGNHVPMRNWGQPLPRPDPLRRPRSLRRDVHPAAAPRRPTPEDTRRVSVLADLAAAGPERLSAVIREHARLSTAPGTASKPGISTLVWLHGLGEPLPAVLAADGCQAQHQVHPRSTRGTRTEPAAEVVTRVGWRRGRRRCQMLSERGFLRPRSGC